jgi:sugar phosphate isomerase/epimerase
MGFTTQKGKLVPNFQQFELGTAISVGDWNIGPGGGRFIPVMRDELQLAQKAALIKAAGATHMEFHDTEAPPENAVQIAKIVEEAGLRIAMCTANLFKRLEFVNGNFGHPDPAVRQKALDYTKRYIAVGIEIFQCEKYVYWNGSNGFDVPLGVDYAGCYQRTADCLDQIVDWMVVNYGADKALAICLEPKPNEPRGWGVPADVGEALAIIGLMRDQNQPFVGLNPETCHSQMAGKRYAPELGLAAAAGKLMHVHLNGGSGNPKFDEDRAFGDIDPSVAVETVWTLKEIGYNSVVGLDVQPLPTDTNEQQAESIGRSIRNFKRALMCCDRIDANELNLYRLAGNQAAIAELFAAAVMGC